MLDPSVGRWLEQDPLGFEAGDDNLYRYVGNSPTDATDPSGLAKKDDEKMVEVKNLREITRNEVVFQVSALIYSDGSLTIKVKEAPGLTPHKARFPFRAIVAGEAFGDNEKGQDTDSVQVAVRWTDAKGNDVAYQTNAMLQGKRDRGAKWKFGSDKDGMEVATKTFDTTDASKATQLNVIVLYTDAIADKGLKNDVSLVIASFEAKRAGAPPAWTINAIPEDVFKGVASVRSLEDHRKDIQDKTEEVLEKRTGYGLRHRDGNPNTCNTEWDTGYDIVPGRGQFPLCPFPVVF
jgi:uncharacterized protein RhaS with RHS repeats